MSSLLAQTFFPFLPFHKPLSFTPKGFLLLIGMVLSFGMEIIDYMFINIYTFIFGMYANNHK